MPEPPRLTHSHSFSFSEGFNAPVNSVFVKATESFKVLSECPSMVMALFNHYRDHVFFNTNCPPLVALGVDALCLKAPPQAHKLQRSLFREFMTLQAKTLNFLTWSLHKNGPFTPELKERLMASIIDLLTICPSEFSTNRKDILTSTRYLVGTDVRDSFYPHVDQILDERVLLGPGGQGPDQLRYLAYQVLAEFSTRLRDRFTLPQITGMIHIFSKNVHDGTLPISIQSMSVRMMLNMVDLINKMYSKDPQHCRKLLDWIMRTIVTKFGSLRSYLPRLEAAEKVRLMEQEDKDVGAIKSLSAKLER